MSRARDVASNNLAVDTTPTLQGDLTMGSNAIADGVLPVKNNGTQSELRLYCEAGSHYVGLKSPAHSAFSGNHTITMPPNTGTSGQFLSTDGNGVTSWGDAGGGSRTLISSTNLSGAASLSRTSDFSASYSRYEIHARGVKLSASASVRFQYIDDQGTVISSGNYYGWSSRRAYNDLDRSNNIQLPDANSGSGLVVLSGYNGAGTAEFNPDQNTGRYWNAELVVYDPFKNMVATGDTINSTNNLVLMKWQAIDRSVVNKTEGFVQHGDQTRRIAGFKFFLSGTATFTGGQVLVFGVAA